MRPLLVEMTGFRSWENAEIDFRDRDLLVVLGDTGAGKSSILDAIAFSLYARTPEETRSGRLLRSGSEHGEVRLTFAADGRCWRVSRRFGPGAPEPGHLLEEISDGEVRRDAVGESAVNARIALLTGMTFPAFTSAILLAQGRFAEFLVAAPRRRDDVLREIFGVAPLEAAREAAGRTAARHEGEAEALERRADGDPGGPASLVATARAVRSAAAALSHLRLSLPRLERADVLRSQAGECEERADAIDEALTRLPDAARRRSLREAADESRSRAEAAEAALADARTEVEAAMEALGAGRARLGGDGATLARLAEAARAFEAARDELPGLERAVATSRDARDRATARVAETTRAREIAESAARAEIQRDQAREARRAAVLAREGAARAAAAAAAEAAVAADRAAEADAALRRAERDRDEVRAVHAAAHLRAALEPGDDCPVCGGVVGIIEGIGDVDEAAGDERVREAREEARAAERHAAATAAGRRAADGRLTEADRQLDAAEAALRDAPSGEDPVGDAGLARARRAAEEAAGAAARAEGQLAAREEELARARAAQEARRTLLGSRADADDPLVQILAASDEMAALEERGHLAASELQQKLARAEAERARARALADGELADLGRALDELRRLLAPDGGGEDADALIATAREAASRAREAARVGRRQAEALHEAVSPGPELGDPRRRAGALERSRGVLAEASASYREQVARTRRAREAAGDAQRARSAAARHRQVAEDLRANRFPRFVIERHRRRLAEVSSRWLEDLTGDDLRFAAEEPDPLAIVDRRSADEPRPASTLSGGERFLASLALALGLGEIASEGGGPPACLFVDEGFAALDADALDQALSALEGIAAHDRLVVVITHLAGVAERLGGALTVVKDASGTSRVLSPAGSPPRAARLVRAT